MSEQDGWDQAAADAARFLPTVEGYAPRAQWDYMQYSNGFGTEARFAGECVSPADSYDRMVHYLQKDLPVMRELFADVNVPHNMKVALLSRAYNLGYKKGHNHDIAFEKFDGKKIAALLKDGKVKEAIDIFATKIEAGGKPNDALRNRRPKEMRLAATPGDEFKPPQHEVGTFLTNNARFLELKAKNACVSDSAVPVTEAGATAPKPVKEAGFIPHI